SLSRLRVRGVALGDAGEMEALLAHDRHREREDADPGRDRRQRPAHSLPAGPAALSRARGHRRPDRVRALPARGSLGPGAPAPRLLADGNPRLVRPLGALRRRSGGRAAAPTHSRTPSRSPGPPKATDPAALERRAPSRRLRELERRSREYGTGAAER